MLGMSIILRTENLIIIKMNNILKNAKSVEASYPGFGVKKNTEYCTSYDLVTGSYGNYEEVISTRDEACYNYFFYNQGAMANSDFSKESSQKFIAYALTKDSRLTEEEIKLYIKELKKLGIRFKVKIEDNYDLNQYTNYKTNAHCYNKQKVYILVVNLKDVSSASLKVLLYFWRYIYEKDHDLIIKESLKYKKRFKKYSFFSILNLAQATHNHLVQFMDTDSNYVLKDWKGRSCAGWKCYGKSVHCLTRKFKKGITLKSIKNYIKQIKHTPPINDTIITDLFKGEGIDISYMNYGYRADNMILSHYYPFNMKEDLNKQIKEYFNTSDDKFKKLVFKNHNMENITDIKIKRVKD